MKVFVDSDAFIALYKEDDSNHKKAIKVFQRLKQTAGSFVTSNYVFAESITVLSQRINQKAALEFIAIMKDPGAEFPVLWINEQLETKAIEIFKRQTSKNVSFVDSTNMALLMRERIELIFSFDQVYRKNGFSSSEDL